MAPKIYFKHFLFDSPKTHEFYEAIGRNVVVWGRFEATMDDAILRIMHHRAALSAPQVVPTSFKKKIDLWKRLFKTEPMVQGCREDALKMASDALTLFKRRNELIHASIDSFTDDAPAKALRFEHKQDGETYLHAFEVGTESLSKLLDDTRALYSALSRSAMHTLLGSLAPPD